MSLQTTFISMKNISLTCTQLGRMIEQHMFNDAYMVFELGTQYVNIIEQKTNDHFEKRLRQTKESIYEPEEDAHFWMKINWIKEVHRQSLSGEITITTFDMINCYQFLLEITDWYIHTFETNIAKLPHIKELQLVVQKEAFRQHDPIWQQISKANTYFEQPSVLHEEEPNGITISYKDSIIYIPKNKESIKLQHLEIQGCNHFLRELSHINIHTLNDLPKQLDNIYLQLTGVGPTTVKKMWNQLIELFSSKVITPDTHEYINEYRTIRFSGESIELTSDLACLPIQEKDFPGSFRAIQSMKENGIRTFGELPDQLLELKKLPGVGRIRVKQLFIHMRELFPRLEEEQSLQDLTNNERIHHENEQYVEWFLNIEENNTFAKREKLPNRYMRIVNERYKSLLTKEHLTLQQLGDMEGITRERVRQIIYRGNKLIAYKWRTYIECVKEKLNTEGNVLVEKRFLLNNLSDYVMVQAFELEGIYLHEKNSMRLLSQMDKTLFNRCIEEIKESFHTTFDLVIINEATFKAYCKEQAENYCLPIIFIQTLISKWIYWMDNNEGTLKDVSKANIVEMVMLNYPSGVAIYKEEAQLNEEANNLMPGKFVSERDFTAVFSRQEIANRLFLWARGVYIHRDFITADESWVRTIHQKAYSILLRKGFIHVRKIFKLIKEEAKEQRVPNEYALFSVMRLYDEGILSLERFPMIQLLGERRVDNSQRVIEFIEDQEKHVTKQELIQSFVEKRGWKTFTIEQIISDSPDIVQYDQGVYTLLRYYDVIKEEQMEPFFYVLEKMLKDSIVVSVHTLFRCQIEVANALDIDTPHLLYALLKQWNHTDASFERFPYILSNNAPSESINNRVLIEEFIAGQQSIVTRQEAIHWLTTISEAGESTLDFALNTSQEILYYKRGQYGEYIHRNTIGMDGKNEKQLLINVEKVYNELRRKTGKKYMLLQDVYHHIELPTLTNNIVWNDVLLTDLIKASKRWDIFGSYDEIYMPRGLAYENDIDFIEHILMTEFNGVISLPSLRLYLAEIRYSSTGDFRVVVEKALLNHETPFILADGLIIHKSQLAVFEQK